MSLPALTALSSKTLSLILERQRLRSLPSFTPTHPTAASQLAHIIRNLAQMRATVLVLDAAPDDLAPLCSLYERMRTMLDGEADIPSMAPDAEPAHRLASQVPSPSPPPSPLPANDARYTPYTDDPDPSQDHGIMMQTQRQLMSQQDDHLEHLSHSISRQHHISLQINDELTVHTGLLEQLDTDLDRTDSRLESARRTLDRVARGAQENSSTVTIGILILVLLILIILFKT